jgi:Microsomal signal peptidase 25 kDa subunit (SPC25)
VKKNVPIYRLKVLYEAYSGKKWEDKEVEGRFAEWFNEDGSLQHGELKKWLANNVEVIGKADPQSKKMIESGVSEKPVEVVVETPLSSGLETPSSSKGTRRSKRKA